MIHNIVLSHDVALRVLQDISRDPGCPAVALHGSTRAEQADLVSSLAAWRAQQAALGLVRSIDALTEGAACLSTFQAGQAFLPPTDDRPHVVLVEDLSGASSQERADLGAAILDPHARARLLGPNAMLVLLDSAFGEQGLHLEAFASRLLHINLPDTAA